MLIFNYLQMFQRYNQRVTADIVQMDDHEIEDDGDFVAPLPVRNLLSMKDSSLTNKNYFS